MLISTPKWKPVSLILVLMLFHVWLQHAFLEEQYVVFLQRSPVSLSSQVLAAIRGTCAPTPGSLAMTQNQTCQEMCVRARVRVVSEA